MDELSFTDTDLRQLPSTISIINQVAETHPHLGAPVVFLKLIDYSDIGCVEVGPLGTGKSTALHAVRSLAHRQVFTKKFTLASSKRFSKMFSNSSLTWLNLEMSDLTDMVMENMLRVVGDLIYDHVCEINTANYSCNIINSTISWLAACTYEIFNQMWDLRTWRGTTKDRVMRYFVFQRLRDEDINLDIPRPQMTPNLTPLRDIEVQTDMVGEIIRMLRSQFSPTRAFDYSFRLLKSSAALNHRRVVTDADAKFVLLHRCNIEAEKWASSKKSISSPLVLDLDALQLFAEALKENGVSARELAKRETLEGGTATLIQSIYKHPRLFTRIGDYVFPNPKIISESIAPQIRFEKTCVQRGRRFYREYQ